MLLLESWCSESHPLFVLYLPVQQFSIIVFFNISFGSLLDRSASRDWKRPYSIQAKGNSKEEKDLLFLALIYCYFHYTIDPSIGVILTRAPTLASFLTIYHWMNCNISYWLCFILDWKSHILHLRKASPVMFMARKIFHNQMLIFLNKCTKWCKPYWCHCLCGTIAPALCYL